MKKIKQCTLLMSVLSLFLFANLTAQVTMGSKEAPTTGALLQLKENENTGGNANAVKGLGLPRVNLTDLNNLYPMFVSGATDYSGANKTTQDQIHTGLVVYNTNYCLKNATGLAMGTGLYVWDGSKWQATKGLDAEYNNLQAETAANSARSDWKTAWGKQVIRHQAKANVYEEFTSADFGDAGRWMTTNLAAKAYDERTPNTTWNTGGKPTLINTYDVNTGPSWAAYWGYPGGVAGSTSAEHAADASKYNENPHLGLLYNWAAATGKQNQVQIEQQFIDHAPVQGICPTGWHLPTRLEWVALETEIKDHASKYSKSTDGANETAYQMKDVCTPKIGDNKSNSIANGGFSILLVGHVWSQNSLQFNEVAFLWSSSAATTGGGAGWTINTNDSSPNMSYSEHRGNLFSVRCKKDDISVKITPNAAQQYVVDGTTYATPTTTQLTATVLATPNTSVTWSSSDPTIATVSTTGLVTSVKNGRTIITATTVDGGVTATAEIVVGCGAFIAPNQWKVFMCHNVKGDLNYTQNPMIPSQAIAGDYYQWGRPTAVATAYTNSDAIPSWSTTAVNDARAWNSGTDAVPAKVTANDPCPTGFRMPTNTEWNNVIANNPSTSVGTWSAITTDHNKFDVGRKLGNYLFLPTTGARLPADGLMWTRGMTGHYWDSLIASGPEAWFMYINSGGIYTKGVTGDRLYGFSVRCIAE